MELWNFSAKTQLDLVIAFYRGLGPTLKKSKTPLKESCKSYSKIKTMTPDTSSFNIYKWQGW